MDSQKQSLNLSPKIKSPNPKPKPNQNHQQPQPKTPSTPQLDHLFNLLHCQRNSQRIDQLTEIMLSFEQTLSQGPAPTQQLVFGINSLPLEEKMLGMQYLAHYISTLTQLAAYSHPCQQHSTQAEHMANNARLQLANLLQAQSLPNPQPSCSLEAKEKERTLEEPAKQPSKEQASPSISPTATSPSVPSPSVPSSSLPSSQVPSSQVPSSSLAAPNPSTQSPSPLSPSAAPASIPSSKPKLHRHSHESPPQRRKERKRERERRRTRKICNQPALPPKPPDKGYLAPIPKVPPDPPDPPKSLGQHRQCSTNNSKDAAAESMRSIHRTF